jgi:hypothetical protein
MELLRDDLQNLLSRTPRDVRNLLKTFPHPLYLAGGFVRAIISGEDVSDIDLFGPDKETLRLAALTLAQQRHGRIHETKNAFTVLTADRRSPVQFIHRWTFENATQLVDSFDFTVAKAAVWFSNKIAIDQVGDVTLAEQRATWTSYIDDLFYPDLAARRLRYCSPVRVEELGGSLLRVRKFLTRGYTIQVPSLAAVVARAATDIRSDDETFVAAVIEGRLREVDPLAIIDGLEPEGEEEVHK